MWNPFKKQSGQNSNQKMGMLQKLAMKKLESMSQEEREKVMNDALRPENRDKLLKAMEQMKNSGQVSAAQLEEAKKRLGL